MEGESEVVNNLVVVTSQNNFSPDADPVRISVNHAFYIGGRFVSVDKQPIKGRLRKTGSFRSNGGSKKIARHTVIYSINKQTESIRTLKIIRSLTVRGTVSSTVKTAERVGGLQRCHSLAHITYCTI